MNQSFQQMALEQLDIHIQKNESICRHITSHKKQLK